MTFLEKLKENNPKFNCDYPAFCPNEIGLEDTEECPGGRCLDCWNREMPNTEEVAFTSNYHYEKGLTDAWELAKKIWNGKDNENVEIFGTKFVYEIYQLSPQEVLAKLKAYEEAQIKVGDVIAIDDDRVIITKVIKGEPNTTIYGIEDDGCAICYSDKQFKKTGKHIDIAKILEQIGE